MEIIKYLERITLIFNPDGTMRGSEAHEHTGYIEERDVADAPDGSGKQMVFVVVKPEVRAVAPGDLTAALNEGFSAVEDAAIKADQIAALLVEADTAAASIERLSAIAEQRATTIEDQAAAIVARDADLAAAAKREADLRDAVQRLTRENGELAAELEAARAEAQEVAAVE